MKNRSKGPPQNYTDRAPGSTPSAISPGAPPIGASAGSTAAATASNSPTRKQMTEFQFEAPTATVVQLVGEFTDWEDSPLNLIPDEDGTWQITVELPPGRYAYRFIVDGQWCDDPRCSEFENNPYGTTNALVLVD